MIATNNNKIRIAFFLALASTFLCLLPFGLYSLFVFFWGEPEEPGLAGFGLLVFLPLILLSLTSWIVSLVLLFIVALKARKLLITPKGIVSMIINVGFLATILYLSMMIFKDVSRKRIDPHNPNQPTSLRSEVDR